MILTFLLKNHISLGYESSYDKVFVFPVAPLSREGIKAESAKVQNALIKKLKSL